MSYQRRALEATLPEESPNLCRFLYHKLLEAGVRLPDQDIVLIGKLVSAYVKQTADGKLTALKLLNAEVKPASVLKSYFRAGYLNDEAQRIKPGELKEFRGWIYKDTLAVGYSQIDMDDREDSTICDSCGGKFPADYCAQNIEVLKSNGTTRVETWCNHCRRGSENQRLRDTASEKTCLNCEKTVCEYHPKHEQVVNRQTKSIVAMLPAAQMSSGSNIPPHVPMPPGWSY